MPGYSRERFINLTNIEEEEFLCGICHEILNEPLVTPCCRNTYCKDCINSWLSENKWCVNDKIKLSSDMLYPSQRIVINLMNKLQIKCEFSSEGCDQIILFENLKHHLENCEFKSKAVETNINIEDVAPLINHETTKLTWTGICQLIVILILSVIIPTFFTESLSTTIVAIIISIYRVIYLILQQQYVRQPINWKFHLIFNILGGIFAYIFMQLAKFYLIDIMVNIIHTFLVAFLATIPGVIFIKHFLIILQKL